MAGPTLIASYSPTPAAGSVTTSSFSPAAGELIVVKGAVLFTNSLETPTDSAGALAFTRQAYENSPGGNVFQYGIWTAPVVIAPGSITVTLSASSTGTVIATVERWSAATLAASPVTDAENGGGSVPSGCTITTAKANSVVTWLVVNNGTSVVPSGFVATTGAPVLETGYSGPARTVTTVYQTAPSAGLQDYGATQPVAGPWTWGTLALELQAAAAPQATGSFFALL